MALVVAYDDAKTNQRVVRNRYNENVNNLQTPFLGGREHPNLPLVILLGFGPGRLSTPHFHDVDQFQIMVGGKGKLGRKDVSTNSVHFSRAYTPYGPIVADAKEGLNCLIIRVRPDTGSQHSPEAIASLTKMPNRHPWQITREAIFPEMGSSDVMLRPVPDIQDDHGLATHTLSMKPCTTTFTPDSSKGNGLCVVVFKGSLLHENKEAKALTLVYVSNQEKKFEIRAGSGGLEGLIVEFPQGNPKSESVAKAVKPKPGAGAWHCALCSFVYDEKAGLPEEGIAPGTRWEDVPADWTCPDCAASKSDFQRVE